MRKFVFILMAVAVVVAACGAPQTPPKAVTPVAIVGNIAISEPRVRIPPPGTKQTAAYLTLTNLGATEDRLIGASSPDAGRLDLHAHIKGANGMSEMRDVTAIAIPAGATIPLSPGGLHIMVKGRKREVKLGDKVAVKLVFASGNKANFAVPVVVNPEADGPASKSVTVPHQH
jgi:periplasmic copper chaperone A